MAKQALLRVPAGSLLGLFCIALLAQGCAATARVAKQEFIRVRSAISSSEIAITLDDSFIDTCKDRVTIDVSFTVDKADRLPHPAFMDGDFHIAGRAPRICLPIVAEIKNAASEKAVLRVIRSVVGTGNPVRLAGAWRLWAEHVGRAEDVQGAELSVIEVTNPDHIFEIHPVTRVDDEDILGFLHPTKGYSPTRADVAFRSFGNIKCAIIPKDGPTTVVTRKGRINDVEFVMEIIEDGQHVVNHDAVIAPHVL